MAAENSTGDPRDWLGYVGVNTAIDDTVYRRLRDLEEQYRRLQQEFMTVQRAYLEAERNIDISTNGEAVPSVNAVTFTTASNDSEDIATWTNTLTREQISQMYNDFLDNHREEIEEKINDNKAFSMETIVKKKEVNTLEDKIDFKMKGR